MILNSIFAKRSLVHELIVIHVLHVLVLNLVYIYTMLFHPDAGADLQRQGKLLPASAAEPRPRDHDKVVHDADVGDGHVLLQDRPHAIADGDLFSHLCGTILELAP